MTKKGSRIGRGDVFEVDFVTFEGRDRVLARDEAIACLGDLDAQKRDEADTALVVAIHTFVINTISDNKSPPWELCKQLRKIEEHARELDRFITGGHRNGWPEEPLPAIRYALTAPSTRETGETNIAGITVDGVTYVDNAPAIAAIRGVRAIEQWVSEAIPRYECQLEKEPGGDQTGTARLGYLEAVAEIYTDALEKLPTLSYCPVSNKPRGPFANFVRFALIALRESLKPPFAEFAPKTQESIDKLIESPSALYSALRNLDALKQARELKRQEKAKRARD